MVRFIYSNKWTDKAYYVREMPLGCFQFSARSSYAKHKQNQSWSHEKTLYLDFRVWYRQQKKQKKILAVLKLHHFEKNLGKILSKEKSLALSAKINAKYLWYYISYMYMWYICIYIVYILSKYISIGLMWFKIYVSCTYDTWT